MFKLLIASNNSNKISEIRQILTGMKLEVVSLKDENLNIDPEENGKTFSENALIKARAVFRESGLPVLADDSGLIVDLLKDKPGVYSKRYAGSDATDEDNNKKVASEILGLNKKSSKAKFVCTLAFIDENGSEYLFNGECRGVFITEPKGENGFGYDPYFYIDEYKSTMAQLGSVEKNKISHRGRAIRKFAEFLKGKY